MAIDYQPVFIIGSPRSGTTLLGDILDLHPEIGRWYEPYFVLDHDFRRAPHDRRTAQDATPQVSAYLQRAFAQYAHGRRCRIVVDKSPRNSLKVPFLLAVFRQAKFIHITRDGRDTTLSIRQQWQQRQREAQKRFPGAALSTLVGPQPLWRHKFQAVWFEIGGNPLNVLTGRDLLHRTRWDGRPGWGPQFVGWQEAIAAVSPLQFCAMQWERCVDSILQDKSLIASSQWHELRYEDFLGQPQQHLQAIFDFLQVSFPADFMRQMPVLKATNFDKWRTAFSDKEKRQIGPILAPLLIQLGYSQDHAWYLQSQTKATTS